MADLKIGDTITCSNMRELKTLATNLTNKGYGVECKGWEGIRQCKLTITKVPEENDCDYCRLEPNGDIPQDSKDLFSETVVIPGEALNVQIGNDGEGGFSLVISNTDNEWSQRKLAFNYCPMCGRRIKA